jgi:hypothetical protein
VAVVLGLEGAARIGAFKAAEAVGRQGGVASRRGWDVSGGGSRVGWRAAAGVLPGRARLGQA